MDLKLRDITFIIYSVILFVIGAYFDHVVIGAGITLLFAIYTFFNTKNGIMVLFIYFAIRPFLLEFSTTFKAVGDAIIFSALLRIIWNNRKDIKQIFHFYYFELAYLLFCLIGVLAAILSGVSLMAIIHQLRAFILLFLVFYIVKRLNITKEDVKRFIATILFMVVILTIHGLIEKISDRQLLLPETWVNKSLSKSNEIRIYGLTGNPNVLAVYLSFSLIILTYWKFKYHFKSNLMFWLPFVLLLSVLILTYSRGTIITFVLVTTLFFLITKKWTILKRILTVTFVSIILVIIPYNDILGLVYEDSASSSVDESKDSEGEMSGSDRFQGTFSEKGLEGSSRSGRIYRVKKGLEIFVDNPIFGTGFGTFGDSASLVFGSPIYDKYEINNEFFSDNQYIQIIVQTGVIGTILFGFFLLHMLYLIWIKLKGANNTLPILLGCVFLGMLIVSLVYNIWEYDIFALYFFTLLGYLLNINKNSTLTNDQEALQI